ncbi:hypothetical protein HR45_19180 [Shewanella mangrovi]|uniref:Uncharacterized protein n=1 Tax=Shewanella mangrovi TaxID=1515746 RepID=A0A094J9N7_9GAMM|nr:hypothetical protein [Shewanella mangrovi]KFZ35937.1 hypothetical protein HR45_19180 [Shewanella mangrovi]
MKLVISAAHRDILLPVFANIDIRYPNSIATLLVDSVLKTLTIISGQKPTYAYCTIPLAPESTGLQSVGFSVKGGYISELPPYFPINDNICLDVEISDSKAKSIKFVYIYRQDNDNLKESGIRNYRCEEIDKQQANYLDEIMSRPMTKISTNTGLAICNAAKLHIPFELIEIHPDENKIKVQRNGIIEETKLPYHIELPTELVFNQAVGDKLRWMCQQPGVKEIQIAQQGEEFILKTSSTAVTCELAGIENFYSKMPKTIKQIKYIIVDFHSIKEIINKYRNNLQVKKFDNAILYVDNEYVGVAFVDDCLKSLFTIRVVEIEQTVMTSGYLMFRFSMQMFVNTKLCKLIKPDRAKLSIIENGNGEFSLGMHQSIHGTSPTDIIPIEKDAYHYPTVKQMRDELIIEVTKAKARVTHEAQQDMFGYGN